MGASSDKSGGERVRGRWAACGLARFGSLQRGCICRKAWGWFCWLVQRRCGERWGLRIDVERRDAELGLWFVVLRDGARSGANERSDVGAAVVGDVGESTGAVAVSDVDDAGEVAGAAVDGGGSDGIDVESTGSEVEITGGEIADGDDAGGVVRVALALSAGDGVGVEGVGDVDEADVVVEVVAAVAGVGVGADGVERPVLRGVSDVGGDGMDAVEVEGV